MPRATLATVITFILVSATLGFQPSSPSFRKTCDLKMIVVDPSDTDTSGFPFTGQLPPTGFFDPLGLSKSVDLREFKRWRESELKHGRIAMLAVLGSLVQEVWHPLFGGRILGASIYHFQEASNLAVGWWIAPVAVIAYIESYSIYKGWESPSEIPTGKTSAALRKDYIPGDLDFDPLGLSPAVDTKAFIDRRNNELSNGRLAMLGIAGIAAQEFIDGKQIWQHFVEGLFLRSEPLCFWTIYHSLVN